MPQGKARTKTQDIDYFWLQTHLDLTPCLDTIYAIGYVGYAHSFKDSTGQKNWKLVINKENEPEGVTLEATIDQVLAWDGVQLIVWDRPPFQQRYDIIPA